MQKKYNYLKLFTDLSTLSTGAQKKINVNLEEYIMQNTKLNSYSENKKSIAKTAITLYNMIEKIKDNR